MKRLCRIRICSERSCEEMIVYEKDLDTLMDQYEKIGLKIEIVKCE